MKKKYAASFIVTAVVIASAILLNVFAGLFTERFFLKIDLTEHGLYSVDEQTVNLLASMTDTVDIIVLDEEARWLSDGRATLVEILRNYAALSRGRLRVQYVNPDLNVFDGERYQNSLTTLQESHSRLQNMTRGNIIILSERRADLRSLEDFQERARQPGAFEEPVVGLQIDQQLTASLVYVLNEIVPTALFTIGHGEKPIEQFRTIFSRSGYETENINLMLGDAIPPETNVVVIAGPENDFIPEEIEILEEYLSNGGNLMVFYDFGTPELPRLDMLLSEWGIAIGHSLILETEQRILDPSLIITGIFSGGISTLEGADHLPVVSLLTRPIDRTWTGQTHGPFVANPLLVTAETAYAKDLRGEQLTTHEREPGDLPGPFPIAYHVRNNTTGSNVILANLGIIEDFILEQFAGLYVNAPLIVSLADEFNPGGEHIFIESTPLTPTLMPVTANHERVILFTMVVALPLLIIGLGVVMLLKRRHR